MKFNCGPTESEKYSALLKERARLSEWHDHFAMVPRQVASHDCRWLETIERKGETYKGWVPNIPFQVTKWRWEYRAKEHSDGADWDDP